MTAVLAVIAILTLAAAATALALRNLIHSALWLVLAWSGVAAFYLWAGAEFLAFAQVLIYVGAISVVVLFAVLLTRRLSGADGGRPPAAAGRAVAGVLTGAVVAGVLGRAVLNAKLAAPPPAAPVLTVRQLGGQLMGAHAGALLAVGVILTAALIGAVVIAAADADRGREDPP